MAGEMATLKFKREKETKRMIRFEEIPPSPHVDKIVGYLYVSKNFVGDSQTLTVTIQKE